MNREDNKQFFQSTEWFDIKEDIEGKLKDSNFDAFRLCQNKDNFHSSHKPTIYL